jgi:hypothetical protein
MGAPPEAVERAIVSVRLDGSTNEWDVEVPPDIPATRLARGIADALGWEPLPYVVFAEPPGRALADDETLANVGAWDGALLTLRVGTPRLTPPTQQPPHGYIWKRIDNV